MSAPPKKQTEPLSNEAKAGVPLGNFPRPALRNRQLPDDSRRKVDRHSPLTLDSHLVRLYDWMGAYRSPDAPESVAKMEVLDMRRFHHVGIISDEQQPGEIYVAQTKVHVTNPAHHPYHVEYLRFEPDSPVTGPVRQQPHVAFAVDDLEAEIEGQQILLGPFRAMEGLRVVFVLKDDAVFEYMQFDAPSAFDRR